MEERRGEQQQQQQWWRLLELEELEPEETKVDEELRALLQEAGERTGSVTRDARRTLGAVFPFASILMRDDDDWADMDFSYLTLQSHEADRRARSQTRCHRYAGRRVWTS